VDEDLANFLEDFCDFLDSLEASIVRMKLQIAKLVGGSTVGRKKRGVS